MSEADEARGLGIDFVKAYYGALASGNEGQEPKEWLSSNSVWTSGTEGVEPADQSHVKGRDQISMQTESFRAQQVELSVVDSQFGVEGGLFVMACGSVKNPSAPDTEPRKFIQSFFLSKEGDGYSIRNCILRFLSTPFPSEPEEAEQAEPAAAPKAAEPAPEPKKVEAEVAPKAAEPAPVPAPEPAAEASPEKAPVAAPAAAAAAPPAGKPKSFLDALSRPSKKSAHPLNVKKAPPKSGPAPTSSANTANKKNGASHSDSAAGGASVAGVTITHHNLQAQCYVSNIPFDATTPQLRKALAKFGAIRTIVRPANKGYGFLEFERDVDADRAIAETARNPIMLNNRRLNIEKRTGKESLERSASGSKPRRGRGGRGGRGRGGAGGERGARPSTTKERK